MNMEAFEASETGEDSEENDHNVFQRGKMNLATDGECEVPGNLSCVRAFANSQAFTLQLDD